MQAQWNENSGSGKYCTIYLGSVELMITGDALTLLQSASVREL
jgi:hypothetical protein